MACGMWHGLAWNPMAWNPMASQPRLGPHIFRDVGCHGLGSHGGIPRRPSIPLYRLIFGGTRTTSETEKHHLDTEEIMEIKIFCGKSWKFRENCGFGVEGAYASWSLSIFTGSQGFSWIFVDLHDFPIIHAGFLASEGS